MLSMKVLNYIMGIKKIFSFYMKQIQDKDIKVEKKNIQGNVGK